MKMATARRRDSKLLHDSALVSDASPSWLTYETYYALREQPFSLSSDPAFFYGSPSHNATLERLLLGIQRRQGLNVLTGDIGMGKTTLCRTVVNKLDRQTFSAFVSDPFATREDLLKVVLADFGVVSTKDLSTGELRGASRTELSFLLYEFLRTLSPLQAFAVVFIDEAQNLSPQLLEEIRVLSDSDGRERQLQVVLVGQLELRDKLRLPEMRQVAQRISARCTLEPLDREGVAGYIAHRLEVAGGEPDRVRFSDKAIDVILQISGGVPRVINTLCDKALQQGFLQRVAVIDHTILAAVARELDDEAAAPAAAVPVVPAIDYSGGLPGVARLRRRPAGAPRQEIFDASAEWFAEFDARVNDALEAVASIVSEEDAPQPAAAPPQPAEAPAQPAPAAAKQASPEADDAPETRQVQRDWIHQFTLN